MVYIIQIIAVLERSLLLNRLPNVAIQDAGQPLVALGVVERLQASAHGPWVR